MSDIIEKVKLFLSYTPNIDESLAREAGDLFTQMLIRKFNQPRDDKVISISSLGKPTCQHQASRDGFHKDSIPYETQMKFLIGDAVEILAITILKAAGVKIDEYQKPVSLVIGEDKINGTLDVVIDGKVKDIKSASPRHFEAFKKGYQAFVEEDSFGYNTQGHLYAEADGKDFDGWIVIDKSSGEWFDCSCPPTLHKKYRKLALDHAKKVYGSLKLPFRKEYEPVAETHYKKKTGNTVLDKVCSYCPFKLDCWKGMLVFGNGSHSKVRKYYIGEPK